MQNQPLTIYTLIYIYNQKLWNLQNSKKYKKDGKSLNSWCSTICITVKNINNDKANLWKTE